MKISFITVYYKYKLTNDTPDNKVQGAKMGPIWGQDPDGPHVGPMNFAIWDSIKTLMGELWSVIYVSILGIKQLCHKAIWWQHVVPPDLWAICLWAYFDGLKQINTLSQNLFTFIHKLILVFAIKECCWISSNMNQWYIYMQIISLWIIK